MSIGAPTCSIKKQNEARKSGNPAVLKTLPFLYVPPNYFQLVEWLESFKTGSPESHSCVSALSISKFSWNRLTTELHDNSNIWLWLQRWLLGCSVRTHPARPDSLSLLYTHTQRALQAHTCTDWRSQMAESLWLSPKPLWNSCGYVWVCKQHKEIHFFWWKREVPNWLSA